MCYLIMLYTQLQLYAADHNGPLISICRKQFRIRSRDEMRANIGKSKGKGGMTEKTRAVKPKEKGRKKKEESKKMRLHDYEG